MNVIFHLNLTRTHRMTATIDRQLGASNERRPIAAQEHNGLGRLRHIANTTQCMCGFAVLQESGILLVNHTSSFVNVGHNHAWIDRVDSNTCKYSNSNKIIS